MSFTYRLKRRGETTLPWGTPLETRLECESDEPTRTHCCLSLRNKIARREPSMPYLNKFVKEFRMGNRIKGTFKVNVSNGNKLWRDKESGQSFTDSSRLLRVECIFRKPCWCLLIDGCEFRQFRRSEAIMDSSIWLFKLRRFVERARYILAIQMISSLSQIQYFSQVCFGVNNAPCLEHSVWDV